MNRKDLITKARKTVQAQKRRVRGSMRRTAAPTTDAQGTPEIGGAPADEAVGKPTGSPEDQIEKGEDAADGGAPAAAAAPSDAPAAPAAGAPTVKIADGSAVALVKIQDSISTMKSDIEIKKEVIKEMEKMLGEAGMPVAAMQRVFDARASMLAGRMNPSEMKKTIGIIAKAQNLAKVMAAESDLADDESEELLGIKAALETAIEKAQDAVTAISEQRVGNHRAIAAEAMRDIEMASKEYGYWKKLLAFKDAVADSICAVAEFIETKKINANSADDIVREFDELVTMTGKERNNVKAYKIGGGNSSNSIRTVAGMTPAAAADPIAEIESLGMKITNGEMQVDKV